MTQPGMSEQRSWPRDETNGPVVRRSWKLVPGSQGPLLTGLFGFPWRGPVVQAKCTQTDLSGHNVLFGDNRVDRHHRWVPSLDCTCGIYATDEPTPGRLQRLELRNNVIVSGFVRLSGRVVVSGNTYRAGEAQIVGPLTITPPAPGGPRRWSARWGTNQQVCRVTQNGHEYVFWYSRGRRGISFGEWYKQTSQALTRRYRVEVAGLVPPIRGLTGY